MGFEVSERVLELNTRLEAFMREHIYPREHDWDEWCLDQENLWSVPPWYDELRELAKAEGLWNLFLPHEYEPWSPGLSNVEIAPLFETMSKVTWAQGVFNCNAPDRGNMEVLARYGTEEQQEQWLNPLLAGEIRSAYAMTEPQVASSDATNMELEIKRDGDEYVLNGRKWWTTGAVNPRCKIMLVMGKSNPENDRHRQHSTILVPRDTPGIKLVRELRVFDSLHSPGGEAELLFDNVRVPASNLLLGEGRGFEIAQGRLGPGRVHHCMRLIGAAQAALDLMCQRVAEREAFGRRIKDFSSIRQDIAKSACEIEQARLLTLACADKIDKFGAKGAKNLIAMIKIAVPQMTCDVVDRAIQAHGGMGVCQDTPLAGYWLYGRIVRIADGPDEVHMYQLGRNLVKRF